MIKNFSVAILVGLFTYLLSAASPIIGEFSIIISLVSAVLAWFVSYGSEENSKKAQDSLVELVDSINKMIETQQQGSTDVINKITSLGEEGKTSLAQLDKGINSFKELQSNKADKTISSFNDAIGQMKEAICTEISSTNKSTDSLVKESFDKLIKTQHQGSADLINKITAMGKEGADALIKLDKGIAFLKEQQGEKTDEAILSFSETIGKMKEAICQELSSAGDKAENIIMGSLDKLIQVQHQSSVDVINKIATSGEDRKTSFGQLVKAITSFQELQSKMSDNTIQSFNETIGKMNDAICMKLNSVGENTDSLVKDSFDRLIEVQYQGSTDVINRITALGEEGKNRLIQLSNGITSFKEQQSENNDSMILNFNESIDKMKEAICLQLISTGKNTENVVKESLNNNLQLVDKYFDKQDALSGQIEMHFNHFRESVTSLYKTIENYDNLYEFINKEISQVRSTADKLTSASLEKFESVTNATLSAMDEVKNNLSITIDAALDTLNTSVHTNESAIKQISDSILEQLYTTLTSFEETTKSQQNVANEAITQTCKIVSKEQLEATQKMNGHIQDFNESLKDFNQVTEDMKSSITDSLKRIHEQLEEYYDAANDINKEQIKQLLSNVRDDIGNNILSLTDGLEVIATKFTDYEKEKDIIQRLEKLYCK